MNHINNILNFLRKTMILNPIWLTTNRLDKLLRINIERCKIEVLSKWLDVGCGTRPYENAFPKGSYTGIDIESSGRSSDLKKPDLYYNGKKIPFPNSTFDGVLNTQVLEHDPDPLNLLKEISRVLKNDGKLIVSLPFVYQEHEEPYDFFRYSQYGIKELLHQSGFEVESIEKDCGSLETLAILFNVYIIHNIIPNKFPLPGIGLIVTLIICFPVQLIGYVLQRLLPDKKQLYLNLIIVARKSKKKK